MIFSLHTKEFGSKPEVVVKVPYSVLLMGNFLELDNGLFISSCIDRSIEITFSRRTDGCLHFISSDSTDHRHILLSANKFRKEDRWGNALKGIFSWLDDKNIPVSGMDIAVFRDIPFNSSFFPSLSLGCGTILGINKMLDLNLSVQEMAEAVRSSEESFIQGNVIPSTVYSLLGGCADSFTFSDFTTGNFINLPLLDPELRIVITMSSIPHFAFCSDTRTKRREAYKNLYSKGLGKLSAIRGCSMNEIHRTLVSLPENSRKLALYVADEIKRTEDSCMLLEKKMFSEFGKLMYRSHESIRDNFDISCPEVNWLVKRAQEIDGILGAKLTGLGDSCCIISLMKQSAIQKYRLKLNEYERIFGFRVETIVCTPEKGASVVYSTK